MDAEQLEYEWARLCERIKSYPMIDASQINAFFSRLHPQAMSRGFLMLSADTDFIKTWVEHHYTSYITQALDELHGTTFNVLIETDASANTQAVPARAISTETSEDPNTTHISSEQQQLSNSQFPESHTSLETLAPADQLKIQRGEQPYSTTGEKSQPLESAEDEHIHDDTVVISDTAATANHRKDKQGEPADALPLEGNDGVASQCTFANFVIGASNRMAYSMALAVAEAPGKAMLNPLFIYGKSGLGKTHLLMAIKNYLNETIPELDVVYVDSAELLNDYTDASAAHDRDKTSYRTFKSRYEESDVLLIDDVQYFQGKKQTLEIVFQIFNNMTSQGKQVVLSADRAPRNIDIDERYSSRFNSGGTFDIQPPEVETKFGIVKNFIEEYKRMETGSSFDIPVDVQRYIAENSSSNVRELKSAIVKVIYRMTAFNKQEIGLDEVKPLLENHFTGGIMKKLTVADIQKEVESYYKVSHADLVGKKRSRDIAYARQVAVYLARQMLDLPYNSLGKSFGGRDHTTMMYAVTTIEEKLKENRELYEELETIQQMIREA